MPCLRYAEGPCLRMSAWANMCQATGRVCITTLRGLQLPWFMQV